MIRVIVAGLLVTGVLVVLQAASQAIDFGVLDLRIRALNSDTHHSLFGLASLGAQAAMTSAAFWRGHALKRHRPAWYALGAIVGALVIIRGLASFNATALALPLACTCGLVCWLTFRDRGAARSVIWAGLALMATSLVLHKVGPAADASTASEYTWAHQITAMVKHGSELAGWMLLVTGIAAGMEGAAQKLVPGGSFLLRMRAVAPRQK